MRDILKQAEQFEKNRNWEEAYKCYLQALDDNRTISILEKISWCASRMEKYQEALRYLNELHILEPKSAKWMYMIGYQYYIQNNWVTCIEWFEKALKILPNYLKAKYRVAYAYHKLAGQIKPLKKQEYWKAREHLEDAHKIWSSYDNEKRQQEMQTYFAINYLNGKMIMDLPNHYNDAINMFNRALKINPDNENCKYSISKVYYNLAQYEKAQSSLPKSSKYYVLELQARIYVGLKKYDEAINIIIKLLQQKKKDYLYSLLSEVYLLNNNLSQALKAGENAVKFGKGNHKNYYALGKAHYQNKSYHKALANLNRAAELKRSKYDSAYEECQILINQIMIEIPDDYIEAKVQNEFENQGTIKKYDAERGFGFITYNSTDIFFHISNCDFECISVGEQVRFTPSQSHKGAAAINVEKI